MANPTTFFWLPSVVDATHSAPDGYTVKVGTTRGGPYPITQSVLGVTTLPVANLVTQPGTYFAIVTAFNNAVPQGESGASNEVSFQITAPAPTLMAPNAPTGFGVR